MASIWLLKWRFDSATWLSKLLQFIYNIFVASIWLLKWRFDSATLLLILLFFSIASSPSRLEQPFKQLVEGNNLHGLPRLSFKMANYVRDSTVHPSINSGQVNSRRASSPPGLDQWFDKLTTSSTQGSATWLLKLLQFIYNFFVASIWLFMH